MTDWTVQSVIFRLKLPETLHWNKREFVVLGG